MLLQSDEKIRIPLFRLRIIRLYHEFFEVLILDTPNRRFDLARISALSHGDGLAFASELRGLRAGGFPEASRLDRLQLRHYLAYGYLSPEGAPFEDVVSLPPATILACPFAFFARSM